jgi:hypothetical protein
MVQLMAGEESPLRKRLKSGNASEIESSNAGIFSYIWNSNLCRLTIGLLR